MIRRTYPWSREPTSLHRPRLTLQLAHRRVSVADYRGNVVLDTLVRPTYVGKTWSWSIGFINVLTSHDVTNYRTAETGLLASHLTDGEFPAYFSSSRFLLGGCAAIQAPLFREVQHRVITLIRDKIIVGHNLWQFLSASNENF